jgi:hypothetical protein
MLKNKDPIKRPASNKVGNSASKMMNKVSQRGEAPKIGK